MLLKYLYSINHIIVFQFFSDFFFTFKPRTKPLLLLYRGAQLILLRVLRIRKNINMKIICQWFMKRAYSLFKGRQCACDFRVAVVHGRRRSLSIRYLFPSQVASVPDQPMTRETLGVNDCSKKNSCNLARRAGLLVCNNSKKIIRV